METSFRPRRAARVTMLMVLCVALAARAAAATPAADHWQGAGMMAGGKGYAPTPMGQVHFRDIGPRGTKYPLLLIHQGWMSLVEFAPAQNELARMGYRSIAVDTPGYGMSDPAPGQPSIGDLAENLVPVLDDLKVGRVIIVGHHTGSLIAAAFAAHHPDRVRAVILHGAPYFTARESAAAMADGGYDRTPRADGAHMSRWFGYYPPGYTRSDTAADLDARTWMLMEMFMMGPDIGHYAVYHYDMTKDARAIKAPTLILTDTANLVHPLDLRLARLRPDFTLQTFSDDPGNTLMTMPAHWAQVVAAYIGPMEK